MDKELYGPNNLFTQFECAFDRQDFDQIKKLGASCPDPKKTGFFINYVRRSPDYKMLDCIFSAFSFSDKLKAESPFLAILFDNLPVFETLFKNYDFKTNNYLYSAFGCSADRIIEYLISEEKGFDISDVKECYDTIVMALKRGYSVDACRLIDILERKGLKLFDYLNNKLDGSSWKELWEAGFLSRQFDFLDLLVAKGGNVNEVIEENNLTLIHMAIERRELDLLEYLAKKGAKVNFDEDQMFSGFVPPIQTLARFCCTDDFDFHFLHEGIKVLVKYGANPNVLDKNGMDIEAFVKSKIMAHFKDHTYWYDDLNDKRVSEEDTLKRGRAAVRKGIKEGRLIPKKKKKK